MNPRDFCREPGYERAVLFSYEFDALFFERIVLRDLLAGGATDIQVVADLGRVSEVQDRWIGQVRSLGKRYRLTVATLAGAFHPKLILRTSSSGAMIWVGSGNISYGGWQSNLEIGTAWRIGPGQLDRGGWLHDVLQQLERWLASEPTGSALERVLTSSWLGNARSETTSSAPVLLSQEAVPLGPQLTSRWAGRRFDSVTISTGSTDDEGAFLKLLQSAFGVSRATILLNPENASFVSEKLSALPLQVELLKPADNRRVHAKCYLFTGLTGSAAVVGSANCSRAAWLLPPSAGGNIESVVVYDHIPADAFQWFLERFSTEKTLPATLIPAVELVEASCTEALRHSIAEVLWDGTCGELTIVFVKALPELVLVAVLLGGVEYDCEPTHNERTWIAHPDPSFMKPKQTQTGKVTVVASSEESSQTVWINDLNELREFVEGSKFTGPLTGLKNARSVAEQQQIVSTLQSLADMILSDQSAYTSRAGRRTQTNDAASGGPTETKVAATDPETLIRSLSDTVTLSKTPSNFALSGISLIGVMRVFFGNDETQTELIPIEELQDGSAEGDEPPAPPAPPASPSPPQASKEKLRQQLSAFLDRLRGNEFAGTCSVEQLVQAAAYPLGVVIYGLDGGWFEVVDAQQTVRTVVDILFWKDYPCGVGLLAAVRSRSRSLNESEQFRHTVGDGRLWTVLLAVLSKVLWTGRNAGIRKALALRAILRNQDLRSTATPARLSALLRFLGTQFAPTRVLEDSGTADKMLTALEQYAIAEWGALDCAQKALPRRIQEGDVHFHKTAGWVFTTPQPVISAKNGFDVYRQNAATTITASFNFYLNLSQLSEMNEPLAELLSQASSRP